MQKPKLRQKLRQEMVTPCKFYGLSVAALPLLLYQGRWVRKHTPRLPPATGLRSGSKGSGQPFRLLVIGDSAAEGVGVDVQDNALLGQLVELFQWTGNVQPQQSCEVLYRLIANTGDTIADIIAHVLKLKQSADCVRQPDLVVISAGVNDVTNMTMLKLWQKQINKLLSLLLNEVQAKHVIFTAVPPIQHFTALPKPLNHWLGLRAAMLNNVLQYELSTTSKASFLKLDIPFDKSYIAKDGFHPSSATYKLWANAVYETYIHINR